MRHSLFVESNLKNILRKIMMLYSRALSNWELRGSTHKNRWFFLLFFISSFVLYFRWKSLAFTCPLLIPPKKYCKHLAASFPYHYFPSFYRPPEIKISSKNTTRFERTRGEREAKTRFFKCFWLFFVRISISRRHKLTRSWLQQHELFTLLTLLVDDDDAESGVIVLSKETFSREWKTSKEKRRENSFSLDF